MNKKYAKLSPDYYELDFGNEDIQLEHYSYPILSKLRREWMKKAE